MSEPTKPVYLATVTGGKVEVNKTLATVGDRSRMNGWFADAVHSLINNTLRYSGVECEGTASERTWDIAQDFSNTVMDVVSRCVDQETERLMHLNEVTEAVIKSKRQQLADAQATVERLKKELAVEQPG